MQPKVGGKVLPPNIFLKLRRAATNGPEEKLQEASARCTALPFLHLFQRLRLGIIKHQSGGGGVRDTICLFHRIKMH